MYNQPYIIPNNYTIPNMIHPNIMPSIINNTRNNSLLGRIGNIVNGIKSFNWNGLINNTSKTLGIINQTIPLVKQVKPMVTNIRSMIKLAYIFKDETDINPLQSNTTPQESILNNNESPTFFIN